MILVNVFQCLLQINNQVIRILQTHILPDIAVLRVVHIKISFLYAGTLEYHQAFITAPTYRHHAQAEFVPINYLDEAVVHGIGLTYKGNSFSFLYIALINSLILTVL